RRSSALAAVETFLDSSSICALRDRRRVPGALLYPGGCKSAPRTVAGSRCSARRDARHDPGVARHDAGAIAQHVDLAVRVAGEAVHEQTETSARTDAQDGDAVGGIGPVVDVEQPGRGATRVTRVITEHVTAAELRDAHAAIHESADHGDAVDGAVRAGVV